MNSVTILAALGGVATVAASLKGASYISSWLSKFFAFTQDMDRIPEIGGLVDGQAKILGTLSTLSEEVKRSRENAATTADIETIITRFNRAVEKLTRSSAEQDVRMAVATFKAHTVHCPTASYIISTSTDDRGIFVWANPTWHELMECDEAEAKNNQWWATVHPDDAGKVKEAAKTASDQRIEFSIVYKHVSLKTKKVRTVHVQAWPLVVSDPAPGEQTLYLGAVKILQGDPV